jgi:hypothetical protein
MVVIPKKKIHRKLVDVAIKPIKKENLILVN